MYTLNTNKKRVVTKWLRLSDLGLVDNDGRKLLIPITDENLKNNKCPFLRDDCRCNIYGKRPWVCRTFGDKEAKSRFLHCGFIEGRETTNTIDNIGEAEQGLFDLIEMIE